jgi:hypothetical protein
LFTYRDKRDINGKNRISPKATMCIHGKEDIPFYNLISVDTGFETSLIFDIFRRGHKSYENFICANETCYYIMKNESENYCKRCFHIYNVENNYCPYCGIRVNEKISKLKSLLTLFK